MSDRHDSEIRRLAELLGTVVRVSDRTRQSLEQALGLGSGSMSKVLGGTVELRVRHILMILDVVGMEPGEFFQLAYPRKGQAEGGARRLIESVRSALEGEESPEPASEFDERVKASLIRLLGLSSETA
jgi:hypothetical protein